MPRTQGFHTFTAAAQITSLVGEVKSRKPCNMAKKKTHADTHTHTHTRLFSLSHSYWILFLWRTLTDARTAFCNGPKCTVVLNYPDTRGFPGGSDNKESACNAVDAGSIPGSGKSVEKGMATPSSILAWRIPWMEEPGGLQSVGSRRVRHD